MKERVSKQLQKMAYNALTGLGNCRASESDLETKVARAQHQGVLHVGPDLGPRHAKSLKRQPQTRARRLATPHLCQHSESPRHLKEYGRLYRVGGDEFMAIFSPCDAGYFAALRRLLDAAMLEVTTSEFPGASVSAGLAALGKVAVPGDLVRPSNYRMYQDKLYKRGNN